MKKRNSKQQLGKGIRALLNNIDDNVSTTANVVEAKKEIASSIIEIEIDQITANPFQPRKEFEKAALEDLVQSIKVHGIIQPITVRKIGKNKFQLISGERRFRASKIVGLDAIPAYVRLADDQQMLEMALIENVQRADLNPIEVSLSYQRLIDECDLTHEELSERIGKNRSTVSNFLRLLKLPPEIQNGLKEKSLSMGHAKAIAGISDIVLQIAVSKEVIENQLSVRQTEALVKKYLNPKSAQKSKDKSLSLPLAYKKIQDRISEIMETKVTLKRNSAGQGEITIKFYSDDDLDRLMDVID